MKFGSEMNEIHVNVWYSHQPVHKVSYRKEDVVELVKELSQYLPENQPRTANLNFWEAYQAMKRGEWVGNDETGDVGEHHYELEDDGGMTLFTYGNEHTGCEFGRHHLDSTAWYIVPKGPHYKVGDRFEVAGEHYIIEVAYVPPQRIDEWWYTVAFRSMDEKIMKYETLAECVLNCVRKLPE